MNHLKKFALISNNENEFQKLEFKTFLRDLARWKNFKISVFLNLTRTLSQL